jgi:hypothetical protein
VIDLITGQAFDRAQEMLGHIPGAFEKAISGAMSRANTAVKNETIRGITKVYDIAPADIRDRKRTVISVGTQKASDGIIGYIRYSGVALPLYRFGVTPTRSGTGQFVHARIRQDRQRERYDDAFIAIMNSGHTGVFERIGINRFPIREEVGASVAAMAADSGVQDSAEAKFEETVTNRVEHEMHRILQGWEIKA